MTIYYIECIDNENVDRANGSQKIDRALKIYFKTKKNIHESDDNYFCDITIAVIYLA